MNKLYSLLFVCCLSVSAHAQNTAQPAPKLSPLTKLLLRDLDKAQSGTLPDGYISKEHGGTVYVTGLIKVSNAAAIQTRLEKLGVLIGTKAGDIWTVQVPVNNVKAFTQLTGISYIQLDEPLHPSMSEARKTTRADSVHMGIALPYPFTGKDVVVGIIDFGFDYGHPLFFDSLGTNYRVKKVWELNTTGTPPAGYSYGHELTGDAAIKAQGTDNAVQMHGTGVAGIAAGSGLGTLGKQKGMAFDADMVLVGVRRDSIGGQWRSGSFSDFLDGVNYIFKYAASVGKPAVVNISWGSQSGSHDGTSLFNQACDNLSGEGKIIVMSAGNEGQENIHLSKTFTGTDTLQTFARFTPDHYKRTWIDIWGEPGKTFCAKISLYKNWTPVSTTNFKCVDGSVSGTYLISQNGLDTCFVDFTSAAAEPNGKPRMTVSIFNKSTDNVHIAVTGADGTIHMWNEYYYYGYTNGYSSDFASLSMPGAVSGNIESTVSDMGSAKSVLLVGAYASKVDYTDINGIAQTYSTYVKLGRLAPFSSRGPMIDGRIKPDIAAPGITLATGTSSYDTRYTPTGINSKSVVSSYVHNGKTYYYAEFIGTSASSPAAAGIVALMLQANPRLTPQKVQDIVKQTAIVDANTFTIPPGGNNNWGSGKINAYGSVKAALQANSIYNFEGRKVDCALFPNPNNGVFTLSYTGTKKEALTVDVYNITGSKVYSTTWSVNTGDQTRSLDLSALSKGTYLVKVQSAEGSVSIKTTLQ